MPSSDSPPQLNRALGLFAITIFGIGDILGAGIYGLVGKMAGFTGNAIWASCLLAGLAATLTGLVYAELSSRFPRAGGAAHFCRVIFKNQFLTFLVTIAIALSGIFSAAASARIIANYATALTPAAPDFLKLYIVPAAFILLLALIALRGIVFSSATNIICTLIEFSGLAIIILLGIRFLGSVNYLQAASVQHPQTPIPWLIISGASLVFYAFIGFEDLANLTEEARNPQRTIPLAICIAIAVTTGVYCLIGMIAVSVLPARELHDSASPLLDVVRTAAPRFPLWLYSIIPAFAAFNTGLMNLIMTSRLLYGMAGGAKPIMPRAFARIHPRWRTPATSIAAVAAIMMLIILAFRDIKTLASGTSIFLLSVFLLLQIALLKIKRDPATPPAPFPVPAWIPMLGIAVCASLLLRQDATAIRAALTLAAVAIALYILRKLFAPAPIQAPQEEPSLE